MSGADQEIDLAAAMEEMGRRAKAAARKLALMDAEAKNACLLAIAKALETRQASILQANEKDLASGAEKGLSEALIDRLRLTPERIAGIGAGLREVAELPDPVGKVESSKTLPNGLLLQKVRVPIGVIGIIYESRPNVTVDAGALCLKAGNPVILRGGSEAIHSNRALADAMREGGDWAGMPAGAVQLIPWTDREAVRVLLTMNDYLDLVIPRGGEALVRFVATTATVPVIKHYKGVCQIYVDKAADIDMALAIVENAKCQRPGVCNAAETLLIHRDIAEEFAPKVAARLGAAGVELRGDESFRRLVPQALAASEDDWYEEYLDLILAVRVIDGIDEAIEHIATYGSGHSEAIVSADRAACDQFLHQVDSCAVYVNASTRFTDGGQFGMGAEIGISTDRLHARGPMGLEELTTYKFAVLGDGQIRA